MKGLAEKHSVSHPLLRAGSSIRLHVLIFTGVKVINFKITTSPRRSAFDAAVLLSTQPSCMRSRLEGVQNCEESCKCGGCCPTGLLGSAGCNGRAKNGDCPDSKARDTVIV